jgi:DNA (cytosine-5)-methyltransferase 1
MDTTTTTHISLCTGYGGIDLGLKRVIRGLRTVALCEIEGFAIANLVSKMEAGLMDPAPIWPDVRTFPWSEFSGCVDILTSGYPCQPFSAAGQRRGKDDPRHLWPWIADGIRLLRPQCCFFENVEGHITLGLSSVISDLEEMGYRTTWGLFSAAEVGAPHQRKRIFIVAHRHDGGSGEDIKSSKLWSDWLEQPSVDTRGIESGEIAEGSSGSDQTMADAGSTGPQGHRRERGHGEGSSEVEIGGRGSNSWPSRPGEQQYGWEPPRVVGDTDPRRLASGLDAGSSAGADQGGQGHIEQAEPRQAEPALGGDADGIAGGMDHAELQVTCDNRTDELRLLGNGVVPATAERAFRTLIRELFTHELTTDTAPSREGQQTPTHQQTNL